MKLLLDILVYLMINNQNIILQNKTFHQVYIKIIKTQSFPHINYNITEAATNNDHALEETESIHHHEKKIVTNQSIKTVK